MTKCMKSWYIFNFLWVHALFEHTVHDLPRLGIHIKIHGFFTIIEVAPSVVIKLRRGWLSDNIVERTPKDSFIANVNPLIGGLWTIPSNLSAIEA